jgi:streptomycin 6-kinase
VADGLVVAGRKRDATTVLNAATKRLKRAGGPVSAVQPLETRLEALKGKSTGKKR